MISEKKILLNLNQKSNLILFNKKTHAKLSLGNSTEFFNEVKQQINNNNYILNYEIKINKEKSKSKDKLFEFEYIGVLKIKETDLNIIKNEKDKEYKTERMTTKISVERDCHFHLLSLLNEGNYLDEHFKFNKKKKSEDSAIIIK